MQGSILARFRKYRAKNPDSGILAPDPGSDGNPLGPSGSSPEPASKRKWRWGLLVAALAFFGVWLLFERWGRGFKWRDFAVSFLELRWRWVAASVVLALLTYYGRALRWAVMIRPLRPHPGHRNLFNATAIGFTATVLLGRPGEFVRPYLIAVKERLPFSSQMAVWLLERILDLLAVLVVFGFALTQVQGSRATVGPGLQWVFRVGGSVIGIAATLCLVLLLAFRLFSDHMRRRLLDSLGFLSAHHFARAERIVTAFVEGMAATRNLGSILLLTFYTALEWVLITVCYWAVFKAFPATAGFGVQDILILLGFVAFGSVVQIPGVGGGVQLVTVVVLTEVFGLPLELATSIAILSWIITFVIIVPFGVLLGVREGLNWHRLKELRREVQL